MDGVVDAVARFRAHLGRVREVGFGTRRASLLDRAHEPLDRVVEELDVVDERVDEAELRRPGRAREAVLLEGVGDDQLDRGGRTDDARQELRPAPRRDDPEEDLGEAEVADRPGEGAEVAVERDLEAAAERGAVDGGERRVGKIADRSEGIVARPGCSAGQVGRARERELVEVGAGGEDERLPGDDEPTPALVPQLRQQLGERLERGTTERVRLLPGLAVVHRHEREWADAHRNLPQQEAGRRLSHAGCSPTGGRRPCRGRYRGR